ncbi:MATE family efflux transporter [Aeromonas caviae]|uniref:hypothetical protein n=1 Tax=Aeromonas caviae TaxID=648 RepID=UPI0029D57D76|nr:hypothetical protein [Aeromonas caviae]MDX7767847.1 hypothetical protein [Aeromonas caviae]
MSNKLIFTLINILYAISQWAIVVVIARGSLQDTGSYSYILALIMPVLMLSTLGLRNLLAIDEDENSFFSYLAIRVLSTTFSLILCLLIYQILGNNKVDLLLFIYIFAFKSSDLIFDIIYGKYQQLEKINIISVSKLIRTIAVVSILITSTILTFDLDTMMFYLMLSSAICLILELLILFKREKINTNINFKPSLIRDGCKLSSVLLLVMLISSMPKYYVEDKFGLIALGVFTFINQLVQSGNIIIQSVSFLYVKKISKLYKSNKIQAFKFFERILCSVLIITIIPGIFISFYFSEIANIVIDKEIFLTNYEKISIIFFALFSYSQAMIGHFLTAVKIITVQPLIFISSIVFMIVTFSLFDLSFSGIYMVIGLSYMIVLIYYLYIRVNIKNENLGSRKQAIL